MWYITFISDSVLWFGWFPAPGSKREDFAAPPPGKKKLLGGLSRVRRKTRGGGSISKMCRPSSPDRNFRQPNAPQIGGTRGRAGAVTDGGPKNPTGTRWATTNACRGFGACATMNLISTGKKTLRVYAIVPRLLRGRPQNRRRSCTRLPARTRPARLGLRSRETGRKPISGHGLG